MALDYAKMKAAYEAYSRSSGGFFRPDAGQNNIRLLPGWEGAAVPWVAAVDHFIGGDTNQSFFCLGMPGLEQVCPICYTSRKLKKEADPNLQEMGNSLAPKKVFLWNLIVRQKEREGPKVFKAGKRIQDQLLDYIMDIEHYPEILDIRQGIDMILRKEGQGKLVTYRVQVLQQRSPLMRTEAETNALFKQAKNLQDEIHFEPKEKLEKILAKFLGFDEVPAGVAVSAGVLPAVPQAVPYVPPPGVFPHLVESTPVPIPVETAPAPPAFLGVTPLPATGAPVVVTPPTTPVVPLPGTTGSPVPAPAGTSASVSTSTSTPIVPPLPVAGAEPPKIDLKGLRERVQSRMAKTGAGA